MSTPKGKGDPDTHDQDESKQQSASKKGPQGPGNEGKETEATEGERSTSSETEPSTETNRENEEQTVFDPADSSAHAEGDSEEDHPPYMAAPENDPENDPDT